MAILIRVDFVGGRYHATPWGSHVNEGQVEWPPSPWRFLRALLAVGHTRLGWPEEVPPLAQRLLQRLGSQLPAYYLPPAAVSHSRHYMPLGDPNGKTTLVIDSWASPHEPMGIYWPVELPAEERQLLEELLAQLPYLGRAEAWVEAGLVAHGPPANTHPIGEEDSLPPGTDEVTTLAPQPPDHYAAWRAGWSAGRPAAPSPKRKKEYQAWARSQPPPTWLACLTMTSDELRGAGWSAPPGSQMVRYSRPRAALSASRPPLARSAQAEGDAVFALCSLTSAARTRGGLPTPIQVARRANMLHQRLAALVGGPLRDEDHRRQLLRLLGTDGEQPARDHRHLHIVPLSLHRDGLLDHVLFWCPEGLTANDQSALSRLERTWMKGGVGELTVTWLGSGDRAALTEAVRVLGPDAQRALQARLGPDTRWVSATPYVPNWWLKPAGRKSLVGQVQSELTRRGLPEAVEVQVLGPDDDRPRFQDLRRVHLTYGELSGSGEGAHRPKVEQPWMLSLRFDQPIEGPLHLGYGAHRGLGAFERAGPARA